MDRQEPCRPPEPGPLHAPPTVPCPIAGTQRCAADLLAPLALGAVDGDEAAGALTVLAWCERCAAERRFLDLVVAEGLGSPGPARPIGDAPSEHGAVVDDASEDDAGEVPPPPSVWWRIAMHV